MRRRVGLNGEPESIEGVDPAFSPSTLGPKTRWDPIGSWNPPYCARLLCSGKSDSYLFTSASTSGPVR